MAVAPAGGLEGGPEVTTQTTLARLAVVKKKTVGAAHPIVVEVVNDRNFQIKSSLIDRWGKAREDVVNDPKVEAIFLLQAPKIFGDFAVVKCTNREHELTAERTIDKSFSRAPKINYVVKRE